MKSEAVIAILVIWLTIAGALVWFGSGGGRDD